MKKILLLLFLIIYLNGFSQEKNNEVFNDTICILGRLKSDYISLSSDKSGLCKYSSTEYLNKNVFFVISDVYNCYDYSNVAIPAYEIIFEKKKYYVKKDDVITINDFFKDIMNLDLDSRIKFSKKAEYYADLMEYKRLLELKENEEATINFINKTASKGICIVEKRIFDESEYTSGTGLSISFLNPTKKTIKYIWISFVGYNAVNDLVKVTSKSSTVSKKIIGPIEPDAISQVTFNYAWFTDIVQSFKITGIKVQYMDNSFKQIIGDKDITLPEKYKSLVIEN